MPIPVCIDAPDSSGPSREISLSHTLVPAAGRRDQPVIRACNGGLCIFDTFHGKAPDHFPDARAYTMTCRTECKPKALFISHGGGPLPLLGDVGHRELVECLAGIATDIEKPAAIIVISAHWEENLPTVTSGATPALIYDYSGFPQASYEIRYPCPGAPSIAREICKTLEDSGIQAGLDANRGFDHGLFVPLKIMYPEADIPCVQLSLVSTLDPSHHIAIGRALRALPLENVLLIGSGFSFHNMKAFFRADTPQSRELNHSFEQWLRNENARNFIMHIARHAVILKRCNAY